MDSERVANSNIQSTQSRSESRQKTPINLGVVVKKENEPLDAIKPEPRSPVAVPKELNRTHTPIYISSDDPSSDDEVDQVMGDELDKEEADVPPSDVPNTRAEGDAAVDSESNKGSAHTSPTEPQAGEGDEAITPANQQTSKEATLSAVEEQVQVLPAEAKSPPPASSRLSSVLPSSSSSSPSPFTSRSNVIEKLKIPLPTPLPASQPKPRPATKSPSLDRKRRAPIREFLSQPIKASSAATTSLRFSTRPSASASQNATVVVDSDDDTKRYTKRARTASNATVQPVRSKAALRCKRHPDYWLLDGSVVIQIQTTLFRLHRSRLVQQSKYFAQLFRSGRPETSVEDTYTTRDSHEIDTVDNCPVYKVTGVAVADFESLLVSMDNAMSYVYAPPAFPELAAILRAAKALSFPIPYDFAARTLRAMWPCDLARVTADTPRVAHAAEAVVLGKACGLPELLKRAYYELLRTSGLGQEEEDSDNEDEEDGRGARVQIARSDLVLLIKTRERLTLQWLLAAGSPPLAQEFPCPLDVHVQVQADGDAVGVPVGPQPLPQPERASLVPASGSAPDPAPESADAHDIERTRCARARAASVQQWEEKVRRSGLYEDCMYDPLCGLQRIIAIDWAAEGYCPGCVKARRDAWTRTREKIWEHLDLWLRLTQLEE